MKHLKNLDIRQSSTVFWGLLSNFFIQKKFSLAEMAHFVIKMPMNQVVGSLISPLGSSDHRPSILS